MEHKVIDFGKFKAANNLPLLVIAGPCQMESYEHAIESAHFVKETCDAVGLNFIFKASFDKANRTSISGKRGIGLERALDAFREIKKRFNCQTLTDVHKEEQCAVVAEAVDILQIPAFLCRQTDLLIAAGKTGAIINAKKGQFLAPWDMKNVAAKIASTGNDKIMLTDRGVTFGYNRLVSDMRALPIMAETGYPVVIDATHSVQEPSGLGGESGGERKFIRTIARAAVAVGVSAVFMETHHDPDNAASDGPIMIPHANLKSLLTELKELDAITKKYM